MLHRAVGPRHRHAALGHWLDVSAHWLRFGETDRREERHLSTVRQEANVYRLDHGWPSKKFDLLNDMHKRMIVEMVLALLRLEGKQ